MEFTQSSEYKVLYDYPQSILKTTIEVINDFELFQQWDEDSIPKFLRLLEGTATYSDNPEADGALLTVYNIVKAYFNYLITENELNMSRETLQGLQESFEKRNELYVAPKFSSMQTGQKPWNWQATHQIDQELKYFYEFEPEVVYAEKVRDFSITNEGFILRFLHDVDEYAVDNGVEEDVLPF